MTLSIAGISRWDSIESSEDFRLLWGLLAFPLISNGSVMLLFLSPLKNIELIFLHS
jgi:hypothetical protein